MLKDMFFFTFFTALQVTLPKGIEDTLGLVNFRLLWMALSLSFFTGVDEASGGPNCIDGRGVVVGAEELRREVLGVPVLALDDVGRTAGRGVDRKSPCILASMDLMPSSSGSEWLS
jgi:hypothetical protein